MRVRRTPGREYCRHPDRSRRHLIHEVGLQMPSGKHRENFQRPAHSLHKAAQGAQVHIGALFQLGDVALVHFQQLGEPGTWLLPISLSFYLATTARKLSL